MCKHQDDVGECCGQPDSIVEYDINALDIAYGRTIKFFEPGLADRVTLTAKYILNIRFGRLWQQDPLPLPSVNNNPNGSTRRK